MTGAKSYKVAVPEGAAGTPPFWSEGFRRWPSVGDVRSYEVSIPCAAVEIMFIYRSYRPGGRSKREIK